MQRFRSVLFAFAALLAVTASGLTSASAVPGSSTPSAAPYVPGVVLVEFRPGASATARADALRSVGAVSSEQLSPLARDARVVQLGASGMAVEQAVDALLRNPNVRFAEPDYVLTATDTSDDPSYLDGSLWGMYGDSANPTNQYGSQADQAWAGGKIGSRSIYVGIIDSGITWTHPDLAANVGNPNEIRGDGIDNDGNGYVDDTYGWDFTPRGAGDNTPEDGNGHGTHVAGTIGAYGGNSTGVVGVNWRVGLLSGRFLGNSGSGSTSNAIRAVDYFTNLKRLTGLNIVATNNSWGGGASDPLLLAAINRGGDEGILFIAAAGNSTLNTDTTASYPSNYECTTKADGTPRTWDCLISVASITATGAISSFSNYGATTVDLGAPGSSIYSTSNTGSYVTMSGTSMATPHVSGAVALCASMGSLTAQQIRSAIVTNTRATSSLSGKTVSGGRLDIGRLVSPCGGGTVGRTATFTLTNTFTGTGRGTVAISGGTTCTAPSTCTASRTGLATLTPTAASGSSFKGWTGCALTSGNVCYVYMTQARSVTANFALATYTLSVSLSKPSGTSPSVTVASGATSYTCTSKCSYTVQSGATVTLTANPVAGTANFISWSGACSGTSTTCTLTISANTTVSASFQGTTVTKKTR